MRDHGGLHVGVEGRVLHLEDVVQRDEDRPPALSASFLLAEQLAKELQQAADGVVVTLGTRVERVRRLEVICRAGRRARGASGRPRRSPPR